MSQNASDPRSVSEAEHALLRSIADNIVGPGVIEPMEKIGWAHGTPPPIEIPAEGTTPEGEKTEATSADQKTETVPNAGTTPAATTAEKTEAVVTEGIDWESYRGANGKILDKYETPAEAVKGVRHAVQMAKDAFNREAAALKRIAELESKVTAPAPVVQATTTPAIKETPVVTNTDLDKILNDIVEEGGTLDVETSKKLKEALQTLTESSARQTVEAVLRTEREKVAAENSKWTKVDEYMRQNHAESLNFTDEISLFVQSNRLVQSAVNALISAGKEIDATELAWVEYQRDVRGKEAAATNAADQKTEIAGEAAEQVRKEAVEKARKDAGIVSTIASGVHETPNVGSTQEEIDAAAAEMQRTGSAPGTPAGAAWRRLAFGQYLNDPVFDQFN